MLFNDKVKLIGNTFQTIKKPIEIFKGKSGRVYKMEDKGAYIKATIHIE